MNFFLSFPPTQRESSFLNEDGHAYCRLSWLPTAGCPGCLLPVVLAAYCTLSWLPTAHCPGCLLPVVLAAYCRLSWLPIAGCPDCQTLSSPPVSTSQNRHLKLLCSGHACRNCRKCCCHATGLMPEAVMLLV